MYLHFSMSAIVVFKIYVFTVTMLEKFKLYVSDLTKFFSSNGIKQACFKRISSLEMH